MSKCSCLFSDRSAPQKRASHWRIGCFNVKESPSNTTFKSVRCWFRETVRTNFGKYTSDSVYHLLAEPPPSGLLKNGQSTVETWQFIPWSTGSFDFISQVVYDVTSINSIEWGPLSVVKWKNFEFSHLWSPNNITIYLYIYISIYNSGLDTSTGLKNSLGWKSLDTHNGKTGQYKCEKHEVLLGSLTDLWPMHQHGNFLQFSGWKTPLEQP